MSAGGKRYQRRDYQTEVRDLIRPILDRTIAPCKQAIKDAGVTPERIEEVFWWAVRLAFLPYARW